MFQPAERRAGRSQGALSSQGLQSTIEHASIVVGRAGSHGRKGHKVVPSEAVITEEPVANGSQGGPIAISGGGRDLFWGNDAIGGGGWSHATWLWENASA